MSRELQGLHGVQFIRSGCWEQTDRWGNGSPRLPHLIAAEREIAQTVIDHGGVVVASADMIQPDQSWYRLDLDYDNNRGVVEQQLAMHGDKLPLLSSKLLSELRDEDISKLIDQLEGGKPFVFAYNQYARGHGKYLIEDVSQLERILRLQADFPDKDFAARCEIRPFVETPSDHDTSLRVDVSPTGKLVSAAFIYSAHTKDTRPVIFRDRWDDLLEEDVEIRFLKTNFEDPESPYYLRARSPRSNISSGGGFLALMGPGSKTNLSTHQMETLEAHGIDPSNREVPADINELVSFIGRTAGRYLHPVLGVDILKNWVIDVNPGPGVQSFAACWPEQGANLRRNIVRQRLAALATIAALHQKR